MTDTSVTAIRDTAVLYIERAASDTERADMGALSRVGAQYQLKRLEMEFDKFQNAQTALIAKAKNEAEKEPLLKQLGEIDNVYKSLYEKYAPIAEAVDLDRTRLFVQNLNELEDRPRKPIEGMTDFDGTHQKWPSFRDLFQALVIDVGVSKLERLLLLKKHCKGPSEQMLEGYELVGSSFDAAWSYLKEIYEDEYSIAQSLVDKVIDMEPASSKVPLDTRRVVDTLRSTLRQLKAMKAPTEHWDIVMMNLTARKIPFALVREWEKERKVGVTPKLEEFLLFIDARSRLRMLTGNPPVKVNVKTETITRPSDVKVKTEKHQAWKQPFKPAVSLSRSAGRTLICYKCEGQHAIRACPKILAITDLKARESELLKYARCICCLAKSHTTNECDKPGCNACGGAKHNYIICPNARSQKRDGGSIHHTTSNPKRGRGNGQKPQ